MFMKKVDIMEYELKEQLTVMNKDAGEYQPATTIKVVFRGKKGVKTLKAIQDAIFSAFQNLSKNGGDEGKKESLKKSDMSISDVTFMLEMTGNAQTMFNLVSNSLKDFATVNGTSLNDSLQDQMSIEDLSDLSQAVLDHFLLPKIITIINSMKK